MQDSAIPPTTCAFGPEGEHHGGEPVLCAVCDRPTCDYCGDYPTDQAFAEGDWRCPDHLDGAA